MNRNIMNRNIVKSLVVLAALIVAAPVYGRVRLQGWCEKGNQLVVVPGNKPSTTPVQQSYPQCTVSVFFPGTTTKATIYSTNSGTSLSNPFLSNQNGYWSFYIDEGNWDVQYAGGQGGSGIVGTSLFYQTIQSAATPLTQRPTLNFVSGATVTDDPSNKRTNVVISGGGGGSGTVTQINTTAPISGGPITTTGTLSCAVASGSQPGCLASADFSTFNAKQAAGNYIVGLSGDVTATGPGTVAATLATVNSNVGSFGDSTHVAQFNVNGKGLITSASSVAISGGGGAATSITSGLLSALPPTCAPGNVYFATDQPANRQIYTCSATNTQTQIGLLGGSGALTYTSGALDITSLVPLLAAANTWTGYNNVSTGQMRWPESTVAALPAAASNTGKEFIVTDGTSTSDCTVGGSTSASICRSNGATWIALGGAAGAGANAALSNLASVAINTALLPVTGIDLGSTTKPFRDLFLFGSGTFSTTYFRFTGTPTSTRTITVPDVTDTLVTLAAAQTLTGKSIVATQLTGTLQAAQEPAHTGDMTNSAGSLTTVVGKVNGVTYPATPAAHTVPVITTASTTATYETVPDCTDVTGNHLNYTQSTDLFSCGTSSSGGASNTSLNHFAQANYTILSTDQYVTCDLTVGGGTSLTLTLPAAPAGSAGTTTGQDLVIYVKASSGFNCTVNGNGKVIYSPNVGQFATSITTGSAGQIRLHYDSADPSTPRWESTF